MKLIRTVDASTAVEKCMGSPTIVLMFLKQYLVHHWMRARGAVRARRELRQTRGCARGARKELRGGEGVTDGT